jgi:hypothetical protein
MPLAPAFRAFATEGTVMRAHHVISVVAVILVGIGVREADFLHCSNC